MRHRLASFLWLAFLVVAGSALAQDAAELKAEIAAADAKFFDAFNACDLEIMGEIFAKDLEFYHDLAGFSDYRKTMDGGEANCRRNLGLRRELVEESHEVYPMGKEGAIQKGKHTFCHMENGQEDCGTFEFVHVWRRAEDGWKIARVISYGH